jgi:hypothetical protein
MENYEQKPEHISKFKKGDIITRVENYEFIPQLNDVTGKMEMMPVVSSMPTGIGIPYEFVGIANGKILVNYAQDIKIFNAKKGEPEDMYYYNSYQNGWAKYINPSVLEKPEESKERMLNKSDAKRFLDNIIREYRN